MVLAEAELLMNMNKMSCEAFPFHYPLTSRFVFFLFPSYFFCVDDESLHDNLRVKGVTVQA